MAHPTMEKSKSLCVGLLSTVLLSACGGAPPIDGFSREDVSTTGTITETEDGMRMEGVVQVGSLEEGLELKDAVLDMVFDNDDLLISLGGEAEMPVQLTDTLSIEPGVKSIVGLVTGEQINADDDIGIQLIDNRHYLIFYVDREVNLKLQNRNAPEAFEEIEITSPANQKAFIIVDPRDPMHYRFGTVPGIGTLGMGESSSGMLPFQPRLDYNELDSFTGHKLMNGSMGIGFKVFDFFEIEGTRVIQDPQFSDINWDDPFASEIEAKAGFNGGLDFSFGVLGFGIFSFDLAETSGTVDLGFDRQQAAFDLLVQPDTSWVPDWFHFVPDTEARGSLFINGNTNFGLDLISRYKSTIPSADVEGTMSISNDAVTLIGTTTDDGITLEASITFEDQKTTGRVSFPEDYLDDIKGAVEDEIDDLLGGAEDKFAALEQAKTEYQFEASLRGLRTALPPLADTVANTLSAIPARVEADARAKTRTYIDTTCRTTGIAPLTVTTCLKDILLDSTENAIVNSAGTNAREEADAAIEDPIDAMAALRAEALKGDSDEFRDALKTALSTAYDYRRIERDVSIEHDFGIPFGRRTIYTTTIEREVMTTAQAQTILDARSNVDFIPEKSAAVIRAQDIIDAIPTDDILTEIRDQVDDSVNNIPSVGGVGYIAEGVTYRGFLTIGGKDYDAGFNVLNPAELHKGIAELIVLQMAEELT